MKIYILVFLCTFFMFLATTLGSGFIFFLKKTSTTLEKSCLGLASGIMIAASIFSLLLPSLEEKNCLFIAASFLLGGFLLWTLDFFFSFQKKKKSLFFLAVTLHNIPEGMAVGLAVSLAVHSSLSFASAFALTLGIAVQNIPEGMAVSFAMLEQKKNKVIAFFYGVISGIVEPIAGIFMALLVHKLSSWMPFFLALAAGTMFYVVVDELIPSSKEENKSSGVVSFMVGFVIMMYLDVILG